MAKKVLTTIKLQAPGGQASPAPPVGPALGQHGINIMEFVKAFNAQTPNDMGTTIPVVITVYEDRSFTFITKTPPAAVLIRQAIGIEKGSGEPNRTKVGTITQRPGARDRREEAQRPQRPRRRPGGEDHRGHRPLDGRGGGGVMAKHGKSYLEAAEQGRPRARVRARRGGPPRQGAQAREVRRDRRGPRPHGAQRPPRRRAAARHHRAAPRPRQGRHDRRLRPGRQGARGRGGRRRLRRRRGPRRAHPERGLHRLRRRHRDAGHDAASSAASAASSARRARCPTRRSAR